MWQQAEGPLLQVECHDAGDLPGWEAAGSCGEEPCIVLAMEVLDNCPHDCICRAGPLQPWQQTCIELHDRWAATHPCMLARAV